jgi:hypothetical protein
MCWCATLPGVGMANRSQQRERAVNKIVAKCMNKKQHMRWNRATVQPSLACAPPLNDTLDDAFRRRYRGSCAANDEWIIAAAA